MTTQEIAELTSSVAEHWKRSDRKCSACGALLYRNLTIAAIEWSYFRCPACARNSYTQSAIIRRIRAQDDELDRFHKMISQPE